MDIIDFLIGALIANAMPHFIFGITKTKFLGLFGYSPKGNITYAVVQFVICMILISLKYELLEMLKNGIFMGGFIVLVLYFMFGKLLLRRFNRREDIK